MIGTKAPYEIMRRDTTKEAHIALIKLAYFDLVGGF